MRQGYRLTFTVGIGFDKDGRQITNGSQRLELAKTEAATTFGGFSLSSVEGGWINPQDGNYISEQSAVFTIYADADKLPFAKAFAVYLRLAFDQSSVLATIESVEYEFIESSEVIVASN